MGRRRLQRILQGQNCYGQTTGSEQSGRLVGCSQSAVVSTYWQWSKEGLTTNRQQGVGHPSVIDAEHFYKGYGGICHNTLHIGLRSWRLVRVPMLTPVHRRKHLQLDLGAMEEVCLVKWVPFSCIYVDGQIRVPHLPGEELAPGCTVGSRQVGGGSVMPWAVFCWETLVRAFMSFDTCHLAKHCCGPGAPLHGNGISHSSDLFQQDNVPCHKAQIVWEWFEEHYKQFKVLPWPPNSPHLNPIKHLWDGLEQQVRSMICCYVLVPDTTGRHTCRVYALAVHSCFGSMWWTNRIL